MIPDLSGGVFIFIKKGEKYHFNHLTSCALWRRFNMRVGDELKGEEEVLTGQRRCNDDLI